LSPPLPSSLASIKLANPGSPGKRPLKQRQRERERERERQRQIQRQRQREFMNAHILKPVRLTG